jgi:hypothetical protein
MADGFGSSEDQLSVMGRKPLAGANEQVYSVRDHD